MRAQAILPIGSLGVKNIPRLVSGLTAMLLAAYFLFHGGSLPVFLASSFLLLICLTDTLHSRIPNLFTLGLTLVGLTYNLAVAGLAGLTTSVSGLAAGLALLLIPYLMGGMGAGDVKALAALGALLGPQAILIVFAYTGLVGGVMAIVHYLFNRDLVSKCLAGLRALRLFFYTRKFSDITPSRNGEQLRFPYAAAIAFGYFAFITWGAPL